MQSKTSKITRVSTYILSSMMLGCRGWCLQRQETRDVKLRVARLSDERTPLSARVLTLQPYRELPRGAVCLALKCQNQTS